MLDEVYTFITKQHPMLKNLERFFRKRNDGLYLDKRDIVAGVGSQLNYDDIKYFMETPWDERTPEMNALGQFALYLTEGNEKEDEDGNIECASFVLSKSTCLRIIDNIVKN